MGDIVTLPGGAGVSAGWRDVPALAPIAFTPTARQEEARRRVRELVDEGLFSPLDWLSRLKLEGAAAPMTSAEWRDWNDEEGFDDWFFDKLYPAPSTHALRGLHDAWFAGLQRGLANGEPRLITWFHDNVVAKMEQHETGSVIEAIVGDIKAGKRTNRWKKPAGEPKE